MITVVNENFPRVLNRLSEYNKDLVRDALLKYGIDIENTPSEAIQVTSNRDPKLKNGVTIIEFYNTVGVWLNGKLITDTMVNYKEVSHMSWKTILDYAENIYHMDLDPNLKDAMLAKKAARADAKKGTLVRYNNKNSDGTYDTRIRTRGGKRYGRSITVDKSGYEINPNKYINMLAELQIPRAKEILKQAKEVYVQLAQKLGDIDRDDYRLYNTYDDLLRNIPRYFYDLDRYTKEYDKLRAENNFGYSYLRIQVMTSIKELRSLIVAAKKYL